MQVVEQVMAGEGVGWLKISRLKKLMEDENYRNIILAKMNRTLDRKMTPDDHVDDVVCWLLLPREFLVPSNFGPKAMPPPFLE